MTTPTFNAENLRKLTDASRQPAEVEHANRVFKELQLRAWTRASMGKTTAGLTPNESRPLGEHGVMVLRELAEATGLKFFVKDGIHVWVKW